MMRVGRLWVPISTRWKLIHLSIKVNRQPERYGDHIIVAQRYLPYEDARRYVNRVGVKNRAAYWRWHDSVKCGFIPKMPHRVYKEWTSWNEFLGTTNSFEKTRARKCGMKVSYRPFWEAVRYSQKVCHDCGISSQREWEEWYDKGECPKDIPKRPSHVYEEFIGKGWPVWLGKSIEGKIMSQKENVGIFCLHTTTYMPKNIIKAMVYHDGVAQMNELLNEDPSLEKPFRTYRWEPEATKAVQILFESRASDKGDNTWLVPNMNDLTFELDNILLWYK